jgi:tryptophan halogenase
MDDALLSQAAPIAKVVICGRDVAAWLAANVLARALGPTGLAIEVVELPSQLRAHDTLASLPALEALHRVLGFDEYDLLKIVSGTYSLGQRFVNFAGARPAFFHPYSGHGTAVSGVPFAQLYAQARQGGLNVGFEDFSLGAAAAKQGRFFLPTPDINAFNRCDYAYHLKAVAYAGVLKVQARRRGVTETPAQRFDVERDAATGYVTALVLADGRRVEGDLFIDATGADGLLLGRAQGTGVESWAGWFPDNRVLTAAADPLRGLPPYSQVHALNHSVLHLTPLQDLTGITHVYHEGDMRDEEALELASIITNLKMRPGATVDTLSAGRRHQAWTGNVVAVGEAACTFNPIDSASLHSLHLGLAHLVNLFPVTRQVEVEATEYNRVMRQAFERLRDFQICHFKLNQNFDKPYWDGARTMAIPDTVQEKIDLFLARGRILTLDEETFEDDAWLSLFFGHGLIPQSWDPIADRVSQPEAVRQFQRMLGFIREQVEGMSSHDAFIEVHAAKDFA